MKAMIKIVSGAQTGVDRAALDAALALGIEAGGWCPAGRKAEDGVISMRYPVTELPAAGYQARTKQNVIDSDGTLIVYFGTLSGGTRQTHRFCSAQRKPCLLIDAATRSTPQAAELTRTFIEHHRITTLNVAGPRASGETRAYGYTKALLLAIFEGATQKHPT